MTSGKTLVVYYSRSGGTRRVAKDIAAAVGGALEEIQEPQTRRGLFGYLRSARQAARKLGAPIAPPRHSVPEYDLVIVGTPIWSWSVSAPVRTYLAENAGRFANVAFFCTTGGSGGERAFGQMAALSGKAPVATCAITQQEISGDRYLGRIRDFTRRLEDRAG